MKAQSRTVNDDKPDREVLLLERPNRESTHRGDPTFPGRGANVRDAADGHRARHDGVRLRADAASVSFGIRNSAAIERAGRGPAGPAGVTAGVAGFRIRESRRGPRASEVLYMMECMNICLCLESQQPLPKGQGPGCVRSCTDAKPPRWPRVWMHSSDAHNVNGMLT